MNRDLNIKSTIRQILGVLISIMILMPFTVSSQTVTTTIDCANATTDINGNGYRWDLSNKILALDGIDLRTSQMMGIASSQFNNHATRRQLHRRSKQGHPLQYRFHRARPRRNPDYKGRRDLNPEQHEHPQRHF